MQNIGWIINDGDWSPSNQVGVRFGQGNGFKIHSGNTANLTNFGLPSGYIHRQVHHQVYLLWVLLLLTKTMQVLTH
jgi:hypothetical protein